MASSSDAVNTSNTDMHNVDYESSCSLLRTECEKVWTQVTETQQQLSEQRHPILITKSSSQPPLNSILREKERSLRAEIEVIQNLALRALPDEAKVVEVSLHEDLQREIVQLKETLSLVESQQKELQASIELERQYEHQLLAVGEKLQEKCKSLDDQEAPEDAAVLVAQELETKISTAHKTEQSVMKKMAEFVSKHFPVPDPSQVAKISKDLRSRRRQHHAGTLSLKDMLLELMTKCVESPEDPYLVLDDRHWPAYTELLLRCNVVLQHPDDDRRVKLVPFHL